MIIKNIYKKININPFFYLIGILSVITGLFKSFIIMYLIIFIHELGHITMALIFDYNIVKINIYPFGGYTVFDMDINKSVIPEFMVFIGGVLFQFIFSPIFNLIVDNNSYIYNIFNSYNKTILLFNLLPIIPLDGSKLLNIILNTILPFKSSHILTIYSSYIALIILLIFNMGNLNIYIMAILLLELILIEHKNHIYIFNKFLLERYIKNVKFKKNNFILGNKVNNMKKYRNNVFIINNKYLCEKEMLINGFNR